MQRLMLGDVLAFVGALSRVAPLERPEFGRLLLQQAEAAQAYRETRGQAHPTWGAGSLMAVVRQAGAGPQVDWQQVEALEAAALGCQLLAEHLKKNQDHRHGVAT